jgi:kynurenine formamidase
VQQRRDASPARSYSETEFAERAEKYSTWQRWGTGDEAGSVNYVTAERVRSAAGFIKRGAVFSLAIAFDRLGPQPARRVRVNPQHFMLRHGGDILVDWEAAQRGHQHTDDAVYMPMQCATQWDAFAHAFYKGKSYNGHGPESVTSQGASHNSITAMRDRAVGRGVLLDFPRYFGVEWLEPGYAVQDDDVAGCAYSQGVEIGEGDFVIVRTGNMLRCRPHEWEGYVAQPAPGLGISACDYLLPRHIAAVASDTWGLEVIPFETPPEIRNPVHVLLLVQAGVLIGEIWDLEELAADCAADGVYEFFLSAQPLNVTGAVGSPLNPVVIK